MVKAESMFKQIETLPVTTTIYIVGDIHGEVSKLDQELAKAGFNYQQDVLYSVGDLIDRGENCLKGLELITQPWFKAVKGNHEDMMIQGLCYGDSGMLANWILNGGGWYLQLDRAGQEHVRQLAELAEESMPTIIELQRDDKKFVICHADYPADSYPAVQEERLASQILWSRNRIRSVMNSKENLSGISGADLFIFGHTPIKEVIWHQNCVWIDTGACYARQNPLTILQL